MAGLSEQEELELLELENENAIAEVGMAALKDAPNNPGMMERLQQIISGASAMTPLGAAVQTVKDTPALGRGLIRKDEASDASMRDKAANVIARTAGPIAGAAIAAPAAAAAGLGALGAAAATGTVAAGGEALQQIASRKAGGEDLNSGQAAKRIGIAGATQFGGELAVLGLGKLAMNAPGGVKSIARDLADMPTESVKRVIERARESKVIKSFLGAPSEARTQAVGEGMAALRKVQQGTEIARKMAGGQVENALKGLASKTGDAPIAQVDDIVGEARAAMQELGLNPDAATGTSKQVLKLLQDVGASSPDAVMGAQTAGKVSISKLVALRRNVDKLVDFSRGGILNPNSDPGHLVARRVAAALRDRVGQVAAETGDKALLAANQNFRNTVGVYDEMQDLFGTKTLRPKDMLARFNKVVLALNKGDVSGQQLRDAAEKLPQLKPHVDTLLDAAAVRAFLVDPAKSPSSVTLRTLRGLATPQNVGRAIKLIQAMEDAAPAGGAVANAGVNARR